MLKSQFCSFYLVHILFAEIHVTNRPQVTLIAKLQRTPLWTLCTALWSTLFPVLFNMFAPVLHVQTVFPNWRMRRDIIIIIIIIICMQHNEPQGNLSPGTVVFV
jgi:hypothetical protein